MAGIYLITTPIGNIQDITKRAEEAIKRAKNVYCEDTRVFKKLCSFLDIDVSDKAVQSYHDHSSQLKLERIIDKAKREDCLFLSDAGSPIISDPAFPLIQMAIKENVELKSIGGISSIICALELSGLAPIPFHFHGFLARDKSKKNKDFEMIASTYGTHIYFEGVSRVVNTLSELSQLFPEFHFAVARELTKEYESVYRFKGNEFEEIRGEIIEKGEFVILIHNPHKNSVQVSDKLALLAQGIIDNGVKPKELAKLLAGITGGTSKEIYGQLKFSK